MIALMSRKGAVVSAGALFLVILPIAAGHFEEPYLISLFSHILIYALAAVSLDLLIGYGGLVSLGHAAFVGVGGYVTAIFYHHAFEEYALFGFIPGSDNALLVWPLAVTVAALFAAATVQGEEAKPLKSGLQPGQFIGAF